MAKFIQCSTPKLYYSNREVIHNSIVNIDRCTTIKKGEYYSFPDKNGSFYICFGGIDHRWIYDDEKLRDKDFELILGNN